MKSHKRILAAMLAASASIFYGYADVEVTINLHYNDGVLTPITVSAQNTEKHVAKRLTHGVTQSSLTLPEGTYDFHAKFCNYNAKQSADHQADIYHPYTHLFKENVEVKEGTVLDFYTDDATNHLEFIPYTPSGERYQHAMIANSKWDYSNCNIKNEAITLSAFHKKYGEVFTDYVSHCFATPDGLWTNHGMDIYVNDLSDNYTFTQIRMAESKDHEMYVITMSSDSKPEGPITNEGLEFQKYEEEFVMTPASENFVREKYLSATKLDANLNGIGIASATMESEIQNPTTYICWPKKYDSSLNFAYQLYHSVFEQNETDMVEYTQKQLSTHACPMTITPKSAFYQSQINPNFVWGFDQLDGRMGDNVPAACIISHAVGSDTRKTVYYVPTYIGQYGELRESDNSTIEFEARHNDKVVCSSMDEMNAWAQEWATDNHEAGTMTVTFVNSNVIVDDMVGKNTTVLTYNEDTGDVCAPCVQFIQFKDNDGRVSQRFNADQTVNIAVATGDYNGKGSATSYYYIDSKYCQFAFAPHGSTNFRWFNPTRTIDSTSSRYWSVFEGSISEFPYSETDWYDLQVKITDFSGNTSVQTLSPAFYVKSDKTGINDMAESTGEGITTDGTVATILGFGEAPTYEVFDFNGALRLSGKGQTIDMAGLAKGVYVVRVNGISSFKLIR